MRCMRLILCTALSIVLVPAMTANAQITSTIPTRTAIAPTPDTTITVLTKRIEALEATIAELQQKLSFIKATTPLIIDPGQDLYLRGTHIFLESPSGMEIKAGSGMSLKGSREIYIEAAALLDLKGSTIRHNGGSVPIACAASTVNGQTAAGGGLRGGEHTHGVTLPVVACSSSVGVPGPGQ